MKSRIAALLLIVFAVPLVCNAAVVSDLYNTGLKDDGTAQAFGDPDGNYFVADETTRVMEKGTTGYGPPWEDPTDITKAQWIWVTGSDPVLGTFTFETDFDVVLGGLSKVIISGNWATDNFGSMTVMDSSDTVIFSTSRTNDERFKKLPFVFDITDDDTYTMSFEITNNLADGGLLVDDLSYTVIPEPLSLLVWSVLGVFGLIAVRRRRKTAA